MLRDAAFGRLSTSAANAAWYCTIPDATSRRTMAAANTATDGDHAQSTSVSADKADPTVMIRLAPKRSIHFPMKGAERPPTKSDAEKTPNTCSTVRPRSRAIPGARMLKL